MNALQKLTALLLSIMLLFGCAGRQISDSAAPETLSSSASAESQTPTITSPPAELKIPQTVRIYRFFNEGQLYETKDTAYLGEENLLSVINHIVAARNVGELPILGISQQKGFVIVDFDDRLLDQLSKGELYELLTTLVMTLRQNVASVEAVQFQLSGEVGIFGETYEPAPLAFAPGDPAEFAAICESIPYEGIQPRFVTMPIEPIDETAKEISQFLSTLGKIEKNAATPAELDLSDLRLSCIWATAHYWSTPSEWEPERYRKELTPIADSVSAKLGMTEDMFWIADHVRKTAKLLCGDDFLMPLEDAGHSKWQYFEQEGVITPPHMGGGYNVLPFVLNYNVTADGYRVEAVYIYEGMGGYFIWSQEHGIPENQLADFVKNKAPRREIILKRADDGGLRFISHRFL